MYGFAEGSFFVGSKFLVNEGFRDRRDGLGKVVYKRTLLLWGDGRFKVERQVERLKGKADRRGQRIWPWNTSGNLAYGAIVQSYWKAGDECIDGL